MIGVKGQRMLHGHGNDGAAERMRVHIFENACDDRHTGNLVTVDSGTDIKARTRPCSIDDDDGKTDDCAVRQLGQRQMENCLAARRHARATDNYGRRRVTRYVHGRVHWVASTTEVSHPILREHQVNDSLSQCPIVVR